MVENLDEKIRLVAQVRKLFTTVGGALKSEEFVLHDDHTLGRVTRSDRFGDGVHLFVKRPDGNFIHLMCYLDQSLCATEPNHIFLTAYKRPGIYWGGNYNYALDQGWYPNSDEHLTSIMKELLTK